MPHTTGLPLPSVARRLIAACGILLLWALPGAASAAEEDVQLWTPLVVQHAPSEELDLSLEVTPRFSGGPGGSDLILFRGNADYRLSPTVTIGGGGGYFEFAGGSEIRPHQQIILSSGRVSARTRLEERFFDGADRMELRLRQSLQTSFPLQAGTSLSASGEALVRVRSRTRGEDARLDQLRFTLALSQSLAPGLTARGGYLLIVAPRDGPDRISHVPLIGLNWRL